MTDLVTNTENYRELGIAMADLIRFTTKHTHGCFTIMKSPTEWVISTTKLERTTTGTGKTLTEAVSNLTEVFDRFGFKD